MLGKTLSRFSVRKPLPSFLMTNPEIQPRVYIADLAAYNNSILHGEWSDACDEEAMWETVNRVLDTSPEPDAEEFGVFDYEGFEGYRIGEYDPIPSIAKIGRFVQEHGRAGAVFLDLHGTEWKEKIDQFEEDYIGEFESYEDLYDYLYENYGFDCIMEQAYAHVPEQLHQYIRFDVKAWARDCQLNGEMHVILDSHIYAFWSH